MINQKESKQVRTDTWSLILLSRDMKTKTDKDQPTINNKNNRNKKQQKNESNEKYNTRLYSIKTQHPWLKITHIKTKEPHNGILSLK